MKKRMFSLVLAVVMFTTAIYWSPFFPQEAEAALADYNTPKRYYEDGQFNTIDWDDPDSYISTAFHDGESLTEYYQGASVPSVTLGGQRYANYYYVKETKHTGIRFRQYEAQVNNETDFQCCFFNYDGLDITDYDYFEFKYILPVEFSYSSFEVIFEYNHLDQWGEDAGIKEVSNTENDGSTKKYWASTNDSDVSNQTATNSDDYFINVLKRTYDYSTDKLTFGGDYKTIRVDISEVRGTVHKIILRFNERKDCSPAFESNSVTGAAYGIYLDDLFFYKPSQHQALRYANNYRFEDENGAMQNEYVNFSSCEPESNSLVATVDTTSTGPIMNYNNYPGHFTNLSTTDGEGKFHHDGAWSIKVYNGSGKKSVVNVDKEKIGIIIGIDGGLTESYATDKKYVFKEGAYYDSIRFWICYNGTYVKNLTNSVLTLTLGNYTDATRDSITKEWVGRFYVDTTSAGMHNQWQEITVALPSNIQDVMKTPGGFQAMKLSFDAVSIPYNTTDFSSGKAISNNVYGGFYIDDIEFVQQKKVYEDPSGEYPAGKYLMVNDFESMKRVRTNDKVYGSKLYTVARREDVLANSVEGVSKTSYAGDEYNAGGWWHNGSTKYYDETSEQGGETDTSQKYVYVPGTNYDERHMVTQGKYATMVRSDGNPDENNLAPDNETIVSGLYYRQLVEDPTTEWIDLTPYMYLCFDVFIRAVEHNLPGVAAKNENSKHATLHLTLISQKTNDWANGSESGPWATINIPIGATNYSGGTYRYNGAGTTSSLDFPMEYELIPLQGFRAGERHDSERGGYTCWGGFRVMIPMSQIVDNGAEQSTHNALKEITKMRISWNNGSVVNGVYQANDARAIDMVFDNMFAFTPDVDLTIKTQITDDTSMDINASNQLPSSIYQLTGSDSATFGTDVTVAIPANGQVTIRNMPANGYTVTQIGSYWRYDESPNSIVEWMSMYQDVDREPEIYDNATTHTKMSYFATNGPATRQRTVTLNLTRNQIYWLDGQDVKVNEFGSP